MPGPRSARQTAIKADMWWQEHYGSADLLPVNQVQVASSKAAATQELMMWVFQAIGCMLQSCSCRQEGLAERCCCFGRYWYAPAYSAALSGPCAAAGTPCMGGACWSGGSHCLRLLRVRRRYPAGMWDTRLVKDGWVVSMSVLA